MASIFCKYFGLVNLLIFIQFLTGCTEQTATNQIPIGVQLSSTIIDINSSGEFVAKFRQHPLTTSVTGFKALDVETTNNLFLQGCELRMKTTEYYSRYFTSESSILCGSSEHMLLGFMVGSDNMQGLHDLEKDGEFDFIVVQSKIVLNNND